MSKRSYWPPPVYVAEFADGTSQRMSFWSQEGKPIDTARGRRLCVGNRHLKRGFVEFNGQRHLDDGTKIGESFKKPTPLTVIKLARAQLEIGNHKAALEILAAI